jgi:tetratricopeptide (TPR) repeat protein
VKDERTTALDHDIEMEQAIAIKFATSQLPLCWSRYSGRGTSVHTSGCSFLLDENSLQLGGKISALPLEVYQVAELTNVASVTLSKVSGLFSLDIAMFMVLRELKTLTVTNCPDLSSVKAGALASEQACTPVKFDFSQNPYLTKLPLREIEGMASVSELECQKCPNLWAPPHEIASEGGKNTMDFLRAIFRDGEVNSVTTLFLIGDGESGKTSVLRALRSPENHADRIREDMRTVGIDTESWIANSTGGGPSTHFQVFDLAGQAVYETTHQVFLQQRAVYLLVWRAFPVADGRRRVLLDRVRHWMDSLQMRIPGARMMLVVTHIDTVDEAMLKNLCSLVQDEVRRRLADFKGATAAHIGRVLDVHRGGESMRVNCLLGTSVALLREELIRFAQSVPWFEERLPRSFIAVREAVLQRVKDGTMFLSSAEWKKLAIDHGMDGQMLAIGTKFLHDTGVVRFFGDCAALNSSSPDSRQAVETLNDVVYLSPQFVASVMKGVVRHDRQTLQDYFAEKGQRLMLRRTNRFNATGKMHSDLVPYLWPSSDVSGPFWAWVREHREREGDLWPEDLITSEDDLQRATQLMAGFDLMVKPPGESEYLVPAALPPARVQVSAHAYVDHDFASGLQTTHVYAFPLPLGAFQRIVVRVAGHANCSDFSVNKAVFFLYGNVAVLTVKACETIEEHQATHQQGVELSATSALSWQSSGEKLHTLVSEAVAYVERFFEGLPCVDVKLEKSVSFKEPVQVMVLSANREAELLVEKAVKTAAEWESVELVVARCQLPLSEVDIRRLRVVLICVSAKYMEHEANRSQIKALEAAHVRIMPLLLYDCDDDGRRGLEAHQSFDLRACSLMRRKVQEEVTARIDAEELARGGTVTSKLKSGTELKERNQQIERDTETRLTAQAQAAVAAVRHGLLPRILQALKDWRGQVAMHTAAKPGSGQHSADIQDKRMLTCGPPCGHVFSRGECLAILNQDSQSTYTMDHDTVVSFPCSSCGRMVHEKHQSIKNLVSSPEVRPCPFCTQQKLSGAKPDPTRAIGLFEARECRLHMDEDREQRSYSMRCKMCEQEVSLFSVFPPEVYISAANAEGVQNAMLKEVEAEADVVMWMKKGLMNEQGESANFSESRMAASLADVMLMMLSEAYACSKACSDDLRDAVHAGKHIVPVLLPDLDCGTAQPPRASAGRSASAAAVEQYWTSIAAHRKDQKDQIDWTLFGRYAPVVLPRQNEGTKWDMVVSEMVSRITSRLHRTVKLDVFSDLSRSGVRLSYFRAFIKMCGGRERLHGKTTFQVMEEFVKGPTKDTKLSWCDHLVSKGDPEKFVATAGVFLSHAWTYEFLDVVDATERHFAGKGKDPYVWFDIFSVSQHKSDVRSFHWWQSTFLNAVGAMGQVVMVMLPWKSPTALTRVWCIFEAYCCEATHGHFSVAMTQQESDKMIAEICKDPAGLFKTLSTVSCEDSEATKAADKDQIFDVVKKSIGLPQLDSMVAYKIERAVCDELLIHREQAKHSGDLKGAVVLGLALADLSRLRRSFDDSERQYRECLSIAQQHRNSQVQLRCNLGLAAVLSHSGQRKASLEQYQQCNELLQSMQVHGNEIDTEVLPGGEFDLQVSSGTALELYAVKEYSRAKDLADKCLARSQETKCAAALHSLSRLLLDQERAQEAEVLLLECLSAIKVKYGLRCATGPGKTLLMRAQEDGLWHPDTLDAKADLARALELQGKLTEAKAVLKEVLLLRERILGQEHHDTLETQTRLVKLAHATNDIQNVSTGHVASEVMCKINQSKTCKTSQDEILEDSGIVQMRHELESTQEVAATLSSLAAQLYGHFSGLEDFRLLRVKALSSVGCGLLAQGAMQTQLRALSLRCITRQTRH